MAEAADPSVLIRDGHDRPVPVSASTDIREMTMGYTKKQLVFGALYTSSCRMANIDYFIDHLEKIVHLDEAGDQSSTKNLLLKAAEELGRSKLIESDSAAQKKLLAEDLNRLANSNFFERELLPSVADEVHGSISAIHHRLTGLGMHLRSAELFVVQKFPPPFDKFSWAAFAPDSEDEQEFGIKRGIYFKQDKLRPFYSQALYAHEVIHTITGEVDPEVYVGGLEEGIAEILGTCFAGLDVLPFEVVRNILFYGRHGVDRENLWSLYRDHTRQAFGLYQRFGLAGLAELVRKGRARIHDASSAALSLQHEELDLTPGNFDPETSKLLELFCLSFVPSHSYSPLDCLLLLNTRSGLTLTEVCESASVNPAIGVPRLKEVGNASALFVVNGNKIGYSNLERLIETENASGFYTLRYIPMHSKQIEVF